MVFTDSAATAQTEQTAEVQGQETTPQESYLQKLVEAKGENWKDPEVLAKGKLEADGYIKTLEEQLAQMREDLKKQEYQAQVLEQLQNKAADSTAVLGVPWKADGMFAWLGAECAMRPVHAPMCVNLPWMRLSAPT